MVGMRSRIGAGVIAVAALTAGSAAMAGSSRCARPDEVTAIQTAAIQQQLMVAALYCHEVTRFNEFQTGYSRELRTSDGALLRMFQRLYGPRQGQSEYHSFKTRLANNSSIRSIHDNPEYCHEASQVFAAALGQDRPTLAGFVSGIEVTEESPVSSCEIKVAMGLAGAKAVPSVVPRPNPMRLANLPSPGDGATPAGQPSPNN
jgi:hypothetical protein